MNKKVFLRDPIYLQHLHIIVCKPENMKKHVADILNTTIDKLGDLDNSNLNGFRFTLENITTKNEIDFIWVDGEDIGSLETLYHELLHQAFKVFQTISLETKYVCRETEEPFCYYYDFLRREAIKILKGKSISKKSTTDKK